MPNAIDLPNVSGLAGPTEGEAIRKRHGILPTDLVVLSVGRLEANKGFDELAAALGATVVPRAAETAGLVVVGSKPGTAAGRVTLSAAALYLIEMLRCPVLVLPHGVAIRF